MSVMGLNKYLIQLRTKVKRGISAWFVEAILSSAIQKGILIYANRV